MASTSFTAKRINATTFVIIEDDSWGEQPHIYAVLHPTLPVLILSDTGCDSPREKATPFLTNLIPVEPVTRLREFCETVPVGEYSGRPLNPGPDRREYLIICTHCHYDHVGGIEQFSSPGRSTRPAKSTIVASAHGRAFIEDNLPEHSLCKYVGMPTPRYMVSHWAADFERLVYPSARLQMDMEASQVLSTSASDLGITIISTPGHTPDELAWYDHNQRHLYVGDSFYEEGKDGSAIIFPKEGDWLDYMASLDKLLRFVQKENAAVSEGPDGWLEIFLSLIHI